MMKGRKRKERHVLLTSRYSNLKTLYMCVHVKTHSPKKTDTRNSLNNKKKST